MLKDIKSIVAMAKEKEPNLIAIGFCQSVMTEIGNQRAGIEVIYSPYFARGIVAAILEK